MRAVTVKALLVTAVAAKGAVGLSACGHRKPPAAPRGTGTPGRQASRGTGQRRFAADGK